MLVPHEDRSPASHSHEFAWLKDAWNNLPEKLADNFPTPEHLRKRALIDANYYDEMIIDAGSNAAALRVAAGFRQIDDFALVIVRGVHVIRRTAKSQSRRAMNKQEFQESKTAIMEIVSNMIGVKPGTVLQLFRDPTIICTTVDEENKVSFKGDVTSLSDAALQAVQSKGIEWPTVSGPWEWAYQGKRLDEIRREIEQTTD